MSLPPGTRIGSYEIVGPLGAGGMGEVYRATDTTLKRTVAIKVLPASVAGDPERLARFQREAEVLAALNHPNIAAIYGVERGSPVALVMEFVEGPTLADRIASAPVTLDEALPIAAQIADALDAAHERGIVHRDLKPANIKVRPDGTVKVLDFGLAKSADAGASAAPSSAATMTSPAMTAMGMIFGTAPYMAPEQARGRQVDRRADIWAFGCVLYEMLTARRAFPGDEITDVIAAIITREPDFTALPASTPAHIRALLLRCFVKDPKHRLRDIGEARLQLLGAPPGSESTAASPGRATQRSPLVAGLAGALVLVSAALAYTLFRPTAAATDPPRRLAINFPDNAQLQKGIPQPSLAYSPDGQTIVYTSNGREGAQLFLRRVNEYTVTPIPGTANGRQAFFSPDGKWIGFVTLNEVRKVPMSLGPPTTIATFEGTTQGATWTDNNEIVFASRGTETALWRVPAEGGRTPALVTKADVMYPGALPGGRAVVVTQHNPAVQRSSGDLIVAAVSLETGAVTKILDGGTYARWVPSGHLVYLRDNALMATPFDPATLTAGEARVPVVDDIYMDPSVATGNFAISTSGAFAYVPGSPADFERGLVALDPSRPGSPPEPVVPLRRHFGPPRLSPGGEFIAVVERAWVDRIVVINIERKTSTLLTSGGFRREASPVWSPDSKSIVFRAVNGKGEAGLYRVEVDGTGDATFVMADAAEATPAAWSGDHVVVNYRKLDGDNDLMLVTLGAAPSLRPLLSTSFNETSAALSADGKLIAYQSNRSGRNQVYVATFPAMTGITPVSVSGGNSPVWAHAGHRLYFRQGQRVVTAEVSATLPISVSPPANLTDFVGVIPTGFVHPMPDGRLLMLDGPPQGGSPTLHVILNWFTELRDKVR
jgi:serine/threonine protein kinase/Tol biopolymer transport system component